MSSDKKANGMKEGGKPTLVPKLRFPDFREKHGWKGTKLNAISDPVIDRAIQGEREDVLSLSAEYGIVLQSEFFGKKVAGENSERYLKIMRNDFVYNDRTTKASTFGTIKRLSKHAGGIVSPIYKCFRFKETENTVFWEWYFESGNHNVALAGLVNEGARTGRFNISITQFLSAQVWQPSESEQRRIAECLSSVDEAIVAQARKVDALKSHKKGRMQQLFPQEGETRPRLRFSEFQEAGEWVTTSLGQIASYENGKAYEQDIVETGRYVVVNSRFISTDGTVRKYTNADYLIAKIGEVLMVLSDLPKGKALAKCFFVEEDNRYAVNQRVCRLKPTKIEGKFLYYILNRHPRLLAYDDGLNQTHLSKGNVTECLLCFPPEKAEQQRIASCLSSLDDLIAAGSQKLEAIKRHKRGLMQQLFPSAEEADG
jgi:type I restriction enzyme S subunit